MFKENVFSMKQNVFSSGNNTSHLQSNIIIFMLRVRVKGPQIINMYGLPAVMISYTNDFVLISLVDELLRQGKYFIFYW